MLKCHQDVPFAVLKQQLLVELLLLRGGSDCGQNLFITRLVAPATDFFLIVLNGFFPLLFVLSQFWCLLFLIIGPLEQHKTFVSLADVYIFEESLIIIEDHPTVDGDLDKAEVDVDVVI